MNSCVLRLLLIWMAITAESMCRRLSEKLRRPALHAFIIHFGTKSARVAPPITFTDSNARFWPRARPCPSFYTQTHKYKPYIVTLPKYTVLIPWWVVYAILLLCWSTPCFFYIVELYPIQTQCWGIPHPFTLIRNYQKQYIAELYPILAHCWGKANLITLLSKSQLQ